MQRVLFAVLVDGMCWLMAVSGAVWLRQDFDSDSVRNSGVFFAWLILVASYSLLHFLAGYRSNWLEIGSLDEVIRSQAAAFATASMLFIFNFSLRSSIVPRSAPLIALFLFTFFLTGVRGFLRLRRRGRAVPHDGSRSVIVGAGSAGIRIVRLLMSSPSSHLLPVAFVDDDPSLKDSRFEGVSVEGTVSELAAVIESVQATKVVIAAPSAGPELTVKVMEEASQASAEVLTLPRSEELFGVVGLGDLRRVHPNDLLNREDVRVPMADVASWLGGKRVLVTGAGGSIGSEIVRQLAALDLASLVLLDRDESALHATQLSLDGRGLLDSDMLVLADIRDNARLSEVMNTLRPHVIFHAAALKHLTLLERNPDEAWKTNVLGTLNIIRAAVDAGVDTVLNISTDKAANPVSVLGMSKLVGERLAAGVEHRSSTRVVSVRFGNVLGSRGSVLTAFAEQAKNSRTIYVTHPEVTRYFMTVEEAVRLTLYAGVVGDDGETLVLDMGEPVKILDVARRFSTSSMPPLPIVFSGLRAGEKMHEVLIAQNETVVKTSIGKIMHVRVSPLEEHRLRNVPTTDRDAIRAELAELCRADVAKL